MKKVLLFGAITLLAAGFFTISCQKDNPVDCSREYLDVIIQGDKSCIDYKQDLQDFLDKDCDLYDYEVQAIINTLDC